MRRQELARRKREALERPVHSDWWLPTEPGGFMAGIVESITREPDAPDEDVYIFSLRDVETGASKPVWIMDSVLDEDRIKIGDWLCMKSLGMRPWRRGTSREAFSIERVRAKDIPAPGKREPVAAG